MKAVTSINNEAIVNWFFLFTFSPPLSNYLSKKNNKIETPVFPPQITSIL
jgi:hypothetical protein